MAPRLLTVLGGLTLAAASAGANSFDFAALQSLIETGHIRSIERLLPALPVSLRGRYALMFASRSLQDASFEAPRAILYGADARFIVTFNGASQQRGSNTLETMEFNAETQEFQFREITFPASPPDSAAAIVSEPNPPRCQHCHGSPAHPVWDAPPLWPGAYGERYGARLSAEERAGITRFLERQATDSRYRNLLGAGRFGNSETFNPSARSRYSGAWVEPPNADLSALLDHLMSIAIARELSADPRFGALQYALLGVSDGRCGGPDGFYPAERWRALRTAFSNYQETMGREHRRQETADSLRLTPGNQKSAVLGMNASAALANLSFISRSELNIPTGGWTLNLDKGANAAASAPSDAGALRDALFIKVARNDPRVNELNDYATSSDGDHYCSYLKARSRAALGRQPPRNGAPSLAAAALPLPDDDRPAGSLLPATLEICASCHESNVAPNIPFSSADQLKDQLLSRRTPHGYLIDEIRFRLSAEAGPMRMPLGVILFDEQRVELESYFDRLAVQAP